MSAVREAEWEDDMAHPRTPVLIGGGQFTYRGAPADAPTPIGLCQIAARRAAGDAGLPETALAQADFVGVVGFTTDAGGPSSRLPVPKAANPPKALAAALGATPARRLYTHPGGNSPQALVNYVAGLIAGGEAEFAVLAGAEFLGNLLKRFKQGGGDGFAGWAIPDEEAPEMFGDPRIGYTPQEAAHGLEFPANVYPLFENAYRAARGRSLSDHQTAMGTLFAPFTEVAAANPHAWFPQARSACELATAGERNRMVGFPYPKYLNAIIQVDQSASVILASYEKARALGVADEKMVFLHGCAEATELWHVLDRVNYHSSPAIRIGVREALAMAGRTLADIDFFDLYSCFPIAVELAIEEIGLSADDPRGLTLTGGLPYFGGPGNNYTMHAIVEAIGRCRAKPGAPALVTANGWFLTKHAMGVYATTPIEGGWTRSDAKRYQREIDALAHPDIVLEPQGPATIETYTVIHAREGGYRMGIVIGRDGEGRRFVANTPQDPAILADLEARESVGRPGTVTSAAGGMKNVFTPD